MRMRGALDQHGVLIEMGATGLECEGSAYHSPRPLATFRVRLGEAAEGVIVRGEPDDDDSAVLCGTCRENLLVFFGLMRHTEGALPWEVRREFGNRIRLLGQRVWSESHEESSD